VFLDDEYCLVINLIFLSSFEHVIPAFSRLPLTR
jgi:hypothetical protein